MKVKLIKDGNTIECSKGFSFTTLFFGAFVPMCRQDYTFFFIMPLLSLFTGGISWVIFPFIYNKLYINKLIKKGYETYHEKEGE